MDLQVSRAVAGERFRFGKNWEAFLNTVDEGRVTAAVQSLCKMLDVETLEGCSFLDVGSGSGLFSLAARRLGARVVSFDYDHESVACTQELKRRYFPDDDLWRIEPGSALDGGYLKSLGTFDVVYSWGVLHHTGAMWQALENMVSLVAPGGRLYVAIYNDQGRASKTWARIKRVYNRLPPALRFLILGPGFLRLWGPTFVRDLLGGQPLKTWRGYAHQGRGMAPWRDFVDWIGGYPFEVAKPEEIFDFYYSNGFTLAALRTCGGGLGCNEYVFLRTSHPT